MLTENERNYWKKFFKILIIISTLILNIISTKAISNSNIAVIAKLTDRDVSTFLIGNSGIFYIDWDCRLYYSEDNGLSWKLVNKDIRPLEYANTIIQGSFIDSKDNIFLSIFNPTKGALIRSEDGGITFQVVMKLDGKQRFWHFVEDSFGNIYAGLYGPSNCERIYKSMDHGLSWTLIYNNDDLHIHNIIIDKNDHIYAISGDIWTRIILSKDYGRTWDELYKSTGFKIYKKLVGAVYKSGYIFLGTDSYEDYSIYKMDTSSGEISNAFLALPEIRSWIFYMTNIKETIYATSKVLLVSKDGINWGILNINGDLISDKLTKDGKILFRKDNYLYSLEPLTDREILHILRESYGSYNEEKSGDEFKISLVITPGPIKLSFADHPLINSKIRIKGIKLHNYLDDVVDSNFSTLVGWNMFQNGSNGIYYEISTDNKYGGGSLHVYSTDTTKDTDVVPISIPEIPIKAKAGQYIYISFYLKQIKKLKNAGISIEATLNFNDGDKKLLRNVNLLMRNSLEWEKVVLWDKLDKDLSCIKPFNIYLGSRGEWFIDAIAIYILDKIPTFPNLPYVKDASSSDVNININGKKLIFKDELNEYSDFYSIGVLKDIVDINADIRGSGIVEIELLGKPLFEVKNAVFWNLDDNIYFSEKNYPDLKLLNNTVYLIHPLSKDIILSAKDDTINIFGPSNKKVSIEEYNGFNPKDMLTTINSNGNNFYDLILDNNGKYNYKIFKDILVEPTSYVNIVVQEFSSNKIIFRANAPNSETVKFIFNNLIPHQKYLFKKNGYILSEKVADSLGKIEFANSQWEEKCTFAIELIEQE